MPPPPPGATPPALFGGASSLAASLGAYLPGPPWSSVGGAAFWAGLANVVLYACLNKKWLPRALWQPLGRLYFWPMFPVAVGRRSLPWAQPYWAEVSRGVFLGPVPVVLLGPVDELHRQGVRAVVNMQDEYGGPVAAYRRLGVEQLRLPTVDHVEPSVEDLERAVAFIERARSAGQKVYVHCKGGHGRGAAAAFAWMLKDGGLSLKETQDRLNAVRHVRKKLFRQPNLVEFHRRLTTQQQGR